MTAALDGAQRTALSNLIQKARLLLEADLASTLEGDFGIHRSDGRVEEADALSLNASQAAVRIDLLDIVAFLRSEGETELTAVERLIREAAFTHVNRLVALGVAEGLGILPETIGNGLASQGFRDFAEVAPASAEEEWERFRLFVRICADELSADAPALFDPRNPLLELEPSTASFSELIELFVAADETIWSAPDALGWSYQFFNSAEERKEMRESSAPRNSRELAVRNQFFTPSYVVEFLVQNGLGAHLAASYPPLADELQLLVEIPELAAKPIDLREVSALDPACGSGHFLLGAYDVLEAAWRHAGVEPEDAAPDIVQSLWGIDIDPRATQIAQAAVILRARRHCRAPLPKPNVICARSLPAGPEADDLIATLPPQAGRVVRAIADELIMAPVLGPLLKIEESLDREARDAFGTGQIEGSLSEGVAEEDAANVESLVLATLATIADQTTSTASQRLFAAEAHDAVRFVEAMSRRYTACLMNPPFGEPVPATKTYLKAAYPWIPSKDYNLLAAFVGRGLELAEEQVGTCAAITSRVGLITKTFEDWRRDVLLANRFGALADLGEGVMEDARVEAAAYVLTRAEPQGEGVFLRVKSEVDRGKALLETSGRHRAGIDDARVYVVELSEFEAVPGWPVSYWMSQPMRDQFRSRPALADRAEVKQGLATGDDFRFVRTAWEVDPERVGYSQDDSRRGRRWVPFAKGGEYSPFWGDIHLVVDWENDGECIRAYGGSRAQNTQFYFRRGLTWPRRTVKGFNPRVLPVGAVFADKGSGVFVDGDSEESLLCALGYLLSRAGQMFLGYLTTFGSWEVGAVKRLPEVPAFRDRGAVAVAVARIVDWKTANDAWDETTGRFLAPYGRVEPAATPFAELAAVDVAVLDALGFDESDRRMLDEEFGVLPTSYSDDEHHGNAPPVYWLDEDSEERAHVWAQSPAGSIPAPPTGKKQLADLVSYAVGCAFGRWDIEVGRDPSNVTEPTNYWAPRRPLPPGALREARANYPIEVATDAVMLDESGGDRDASRLVASALEYIAGCSVEDLSASLVGAPIQLSRFLRTKFFPHHLGQYSKSNRKAPIYWQLQVPSKAWGIWLYMPRLSREMLFAVVRETEQRERLAVQRIATLQREYDDGGAGRTIAAVSKELDAEQKLAVDLVTFRDEAERIANLGWEPDLDDGAVLNAAPLAPLFPAWKDAAKYREELKQGKHTWSTVSRYADQL